MQHRGCMGTKLGQALCQALQEEAAEDQAADETAIKEDIELHVVAGHEKVLEEGCQEVAQEGSRPQFGGMPAPGMADPPAPFEEEVEEEEEEEGEGQAVSVAQLVRTFEGPRT